MLALGLVQESAVVEKTEEKYIKKVGKNQTTEDKIRQYERASLLRE